MLNVNVRHERKRECHGAIEKYLEIIKFCTRVYSRIHDCKLRQLLVFYRYIFD